MSAEQFYAVLLGAYPERFRVRFEAGMRDAFHRDHAAARDRGLAVLARFWALTVVQALWYGLAERRGRKVMGGFSDSPDRSPTSRASWFTVDWRDAWRSLMATPTVTSVAVLSLALGIGANLALFTIANSLLLKPLPVREPDRLALLGEMSWTNPIWEQIRDRQDQLFDGDFAWSNETFDLSTGGVKDPIEGAYSSGRLFDVLGVPALVGRTFTERDDARRGGPDGAVAVISHAFWRQRFNGASDAIGRRLMVDRVPFTIVGVMPPGFFGAEVGRAWHVILPLGTEAIVRGNDSSLDGRTSWWLNVMARLKINQTHDAATAALRAVQPDIRRATQPPSYPSGEHYLSDPFTLVPAAGGRSTLRLRYTRPLAIMMGVVGAVLLIACANIANLMLARASSRRHDLSVRLALGASRARIARQLLAETFLLAGVGTVAGVLVSNWCSTLLVRQLATPRQTPVLDLSADWHLAAFVVGVAVATALLFGLAPALGVSAIAPSDALKEQSRTIAGNRGVALRDVLVAAQVALSLAVIVGAGLFLRTFASLARTPLGFDPAQLLVVTVDLQPTGATSQARVHLFEALKDAASSTPGVAAVGTSAITPVSGQGWNTRISFAGRDVPPSAGRAAMSWVNAVSPDWFATYGMRLTAGRGFTSADRLGAPPVVVVNEAFVRQFFQARNPILDEVAAEYVIAPGVTRFRVIGVVSNAIYRSVREGIIPTMYVPMAQRDAAPASMGLTIRPQTPSGRLAGDLAESLSRAVPEAAFSFQGMDDLVAASVAQERLLAVLAGSFGGLSLVLAALGLYGVTSYSVSRRRAEIGIRMALGADRVNVTMLVMRRVAALMSVGLLTGVALSAWASRFVGTLLFNLEPRHL
jgi:predicted permease